MAVRRFAGGGKIFEFETAVIHGFVADDGFQIGSEDVFSEDADHDGGIRFRECLRRPFNEFGKVEQERGFDLIFRGLALRLGAERQEQAKKEQRAPSPSEFRFRARGQPAGFLRRFQINAGRKRQWDYFCLPVTQAKRL